MGKQLVKVVEVFSKKRYPYNGKYHFNISKVTNFYLGDAEEHYVVEHVRRDGRLAKWQPKALRQEFSSVEEAEDATTKWAKRPVRAYARFPF